MPLLRGTDSVRRGRMPFCGRDVEPALATLSQPVGVLNEKWNERPGGMVRCPACGLWVRDAEKVTHVKAKHRG